MNDVDLTCLLNLLFDFIERSSRKYLIHKFISECSIVIQTPHGLK